MIIVTSISIPSRRVGDGYGGLSFFERAAISIPSRRVGDKAGKTYEEIAQSHFHPLKAGRRLATTVGFGADIT